MTYRISLRSSSLWEPRHPLLKVLDHFCFCCKAIKHLLLISYDQDILLLVVLKHQKENIQKVLGYCYILFCEEKIAPVCFQHLDAIHWFTGRKRKHKLTPGRGSLDTSFCGVFGVVMILPQVHLRKPCYDFTFL